MKLPLAARIKKKAHQDIAYAQDLIMEEVYSFFPRAVFHGGTAIWRCYQGNRFSEDIDMYLLGKKNIDAFFERLQQKGFIIHKKMVKENSLYSELEFNRAIIRFEALFLAKKDAVLKEYELADGNYITVYTLTPEELLKEKINACLKRGKARDIYDIFFLLRLATKAPPELKKVTSIKIIDEENLSAIILSGPIPTVKEMKEYIARWEL